MTDQAIVLLSGGQDSTTCLYWAKQHFQGIRTLAFDYGQKHSIELKQAAKISQEAGVLSHTTLPVEALRVLGGAALTDSSIEVEAEASELSHNVFAHEHGLPSTFVPGRNMLFLTLAAAYGAKFGVYNLVTGVCQADAAGYPDCREVFVYAAEDALSAALDEPRLHIYAPLLTLDKAQTWQMAADLGVRDLIVNETHTCYNGVHDPEHKHPWGYGCAQCPACNERMRGYETAFLNVA